MFHERPLVMHVHTCAGVTYYMRVYPLPYNRFQVCTKRSKTPLTPELAQDCSPIDIEVWRDCKYNIVIEVSVNVMRLDVIIDSHISRLIFYELLKISSNLNF